MTTDRELLELAAKAAGIEIIYDDCDPYPVDEDDEVWNPLLYDAHALRLLLTLRLGIQSVIVERDDPESDTADWWCVFSHAGELTREPMGGDNASARRAIVRAAAEIGRIMA